jgi:acyl-CoA hydrolase
MTAPRHAGGRSGDLIAYRGRPAGVYRTSQTVTCEELRDARSNGHALTL